MTRLLLVSGSLREGSSNTALLDAAARLIPAGVTAERYLALARIPAFTPDLDEGPASAPVEHWRAALASADAVLISSPEYAHGIPGALKNALDWVVGSGELVVKPVGIISASTASRFAHPQLIEVLTVMNAAVIPAATIVLVIPRRGADAEHLAADPEIARALGAVVAALVAAAASGAASG
jgi:NAD(P)H-dependent FMN reductase